MSRNPVLITTLDEDMKAIGLDIREADEGEKKDDELSPEQKKKAAEKPGKEREAIPETKKEGAENPPAEAPLDEKVRHAVVGSRAIRKTLHRMHGAEKAKAKAFERSAGGKKLRRKEKKFRKTSRGQRRAAKHKRVLSRFESTDVQNLRTAVECFRRVAGPNEVTEAKKVERTSDRVTTLLEEVRTILEAARTPKVSMDEAIKTFANVAIISETLSNIFRSVSDYDGHEDQLTEEELADIKRLSETAENFSEMAEAAADYATRMKANSLSEEEQQNLGEDFNNMMTALLQGLEVYAEIEEACDEDDDDDDDDEKGKDKKGEGGEGEAEKGGKK